ncbi:MAG: low molecular weight protein arginine phosphatase [Gemmatimonadetes bacterium]|nr:low molecular weight protein arginine phosphatase [Gemmatimonadota bacterium]
MRVLFVCTGNTCRSPLGAAILERLAGEKGVEVRSAGTGAGAGSPATEEARRVAERHGLSLERHRSLPLEPEVLAWADHVLVMENYHKRTVERLGAGEKVTLLSEYGGDGRDIDDPFGMGEASYERVYELLETYLAQFLTTERHPK